MATVGQVAAIVFAAQPQIVAALPRLGQADHRRGEGAARSGPLGYSVKEWTPAPEPIRPKTFCRRSSAPDPMDGPLPSL
ncbi:MAG: hypothetical protein U1E59_18340 [Amaricoccus sp.]